MRVFILALLAFACALPVRAEPVLEFLGASTADLENPHDLKLSPDGRYLLVSDVGNNRVAFLDPATLQLVGEFGADHQSGTHDVEFDAAGRLYVADTHNNRVTIYELDGLKAKLTGELKGPIRGPEGVLAHPNGRIYVAGAWSGNVVAFADGKPVKELKGLSAPHDLEALGNGDIWLSDSGNNRLLLLSPDLEILRELKGPPYNFDGVRYMDLLADGTLILGDKNNHQIKIISGTGKLLKVVGSGKGGNGPGEFRTPEGVELGGDDVVWFSDSGNDRVVRYRLKMN
ncbi:MAG: NHL repeat-containing protein [Alphaproteobacteria bacterium]|nr:NHL repeat-containing protein [Alphaproteobacteria bacterium]